MKYLLLFFLTFSIQAETWIVTAHNELTDSYFSCHPENEKDGNGCNKFSSESEANNFIEKNKKAFGKEERWIHEDWLTDKLADRIIDERVINPIPLTEKIKAFFTRMDNPNSYTEYLIKKDYTVKTKNITAEIESIELKKVKEKEKVENIKKIDIDNMTDDELKLIIKQLIKKI